MKRNPSRLRNLDVDMIGKRIGSGRLYEVRMGDSKIVYYLNGDRLHVASLRTPAVKRRKGSGRRAMLSFLAWSDSVGLDVELAASPLDAKTHPQRLVAFYASLGFVPTGVRINVAGDLEMVRLARV